MTNQQITAAEPDDTDLVQFLNNNPKLGGVRYRIATSSDFRRLHRFVAEQGEPSPTLSFPTVYAEKDGKILGFMATGHLDGMLFGGPLIMEKARPHPIIAFRLIEAYESALVSLGVSAYLGAGEEGSPLVAYAERLGIPAHSKQDGVTYYIRSLTDERTEG